MCARAHCSDHSWHGKCFSFFDNETHRECKHDKIETISVRLPQILLNEFSPTLVGNIVYYLGTGHRGLRDIKIVWIIKCGTKLEQIKSHFQITNNDWLNHHWRGTKTDTDASTLILRQHKRWPVNFRKWFIWFRVRREKKNIKKWLIQRQWTSILYMYRLAWVFSVKALTISNTISI